MPPHLQKSNPVPSTSSATPLRSLTENAQDSHSSAVVPAPKRVKEKKAKKSHHSVLRDMEENDESDQ